MKNIFLLLFFLLFIGKNLFAEEDNVEKKSNIHQQAMNTNWCDNTTGEWLIGFFDNYVIFDNQLWNYENKTIKGDRYIFHVAHGRKEIDIKIGKLKSNKRNIIIGCIDHNCSPITTSILPDYQTKDNRNSFKDNGYRLRDSVTIQGVVRNAPNKLSAITIYQYSPFEPCLPSADLLHNVPIDSLGRFYIRIPVYNSNLFDVYKIPQQLPLEVDEDYFFYFDIANNQHLVMGRNARLVNELIAHPINTLEIINGRKVDINQRLNAINQANNNCISCLDSIISRHVNLSERYKIWWRERIRNSYAFSLLSDEDMLNRKVEENEIISIINEGDYLNPQLPLTLYADAYDIINGYMTRLKNITVKANLGDVINDGYFKIGDDVKPMIRKLKEVHELAQKGDTIAARHIYEVDIKAIPNYEKLQDSLNEILDPMLEKVQNVKYLNTIMLKADSMKLRSDLRDLYFTNELVLNMNGTPAWLQLSQWARANVKSPWMLNFFNEQNAFFLDISNEASNMKFDDNKSLEELTKGSDIFNHIIKPFKGKIIYVDVWGTWCGPCRQEMIYVPALKESLKDKDIVYIYLCNGSTDESWRNAIKRYHLEGDNCVHYNLPGKQENALERYLRVNGYPSYRLVNRQGKLLQGEAPQPSCTEVLKSTINSIK
ncbi:MAG TPA: TlpA family protein disulfide reductase [Thomasclavelia ramosa]|nr:TlpA family protein disulfide reductase [Thomasclavelia ramosa]